MVKLKIDSMHCKSCFLNIEDALKEYDPAIEAKADIDNRILTVEADHPAEKLKQLIESAGYPVNQVIN